MATYTELFNLRRDDGLRGRIASAIAIQADTIRTEAGATTNHANRLTWAKLAFQNPEARADEMMWALLAANKASTVAQIQSASDSTLQTAVAAAVDIFATG